MDTDRAAWVALALTPGIGAARLDTLLSRFGSARRVLEAPLSVLLEVDGVGPALATALSARSPSDGEQAVAAAEAVGGLVLVPADPEFPAALRRIPEPPPVLFARGRLELLERPAIAVVGSRDHTPYGAEACRAVAGHAASAGIVVVSGMARGLDAVAHTAALDAGGATIGVLGNGLGVVYPAANSRLYDRVAAEGLLITEFPPGDRPTAGSFPRRNRLISGLARLTVVVEAAVGSGAIITADAALEQGREVGAVPGPITSPTSVACNRLIRDGATPIIEPVDLQGFYPNVRAWPETMTAAPAVRPLPATLSPGDRALAEALGQAPTHIDALTAQFDRPVGLLLAQLGMLEIAGVVEQRPIGMFRRL
ncbi:MAG: DNA-processing protein DprA [Gemmatimonadales bacterium]